VEKVEKEKGGKETSSKNKKDQLKRKALTSIKRAFKFKKGKKKLRKRKKHQINITLG
jgi:hypothetical protein